MTTPLELHLELDSGAPRPAGRVVAVNTGSASLRLWNEGNSWGDAALRFEAHRGTGVCTIQRRPQEYTRNVPSSFELRPGERHEWRFDLGSGEWDAGDLSGALTAVYTIPPTPEAREQGVWTGEVRSEPVSL